MVQEKNGAQELLLGKYPHPNSRAEKASPLRPHTYRQPLVTRSPVCAPPGTAQPLLLKRLSRWSCLQKNLLVGDRGERNHGAQPLGRVGRMVGT